MDLKLVSISMVQHLYKNQSNVVTIRSDHQRVGKRVPIKMFKFKVILLVISILQFSVCHSISVVSPLCEYENDHSFGAHIDINCKGLALSAVVSDNLKKDVKLFASVAAVLFKSCEIGEFLEMHEWNRQNRSRNISQIE